MRFKFSYRELFEGEVERKERYKKSMEPMFEFLHKLRSSEEVEKEKFFGIKAGEGFDPQDIEKIMNSLCQIEVMDKKAKKQKIADLLEFFEKIQRKISNVKSMNSDIDQNIIPFLKEYGDPFQYPEINREFFEKYST